MQMATTCYYCLAAFLTVLLLVHAGQLKLSDSVLLPWTLFSAALHEHLQNELLAGAVQTEGQRGHSRVLLLLLHNCSFSDC